MSNDKEKKKREKKRAASSTNKATSASAVSKMSRMNKKRAANQEFIFAINTVYTLKYKRLCIVLETLGNHHDAVFFKENVQ